MTEDIVKRYTGIEWTDRTWNPMTGCNKVSPGCANCYAESIAHRFWGDRQFSDVVFHEDRLSEPLRWRKPAKIFVNSMSDWLHPSITDAQILKMWEVMHEAHKKHGHIFQLLTKRADRLETVLGPDGIGWYAKNGNVPHPEPGIWLGVTVENQKTADDRIPKLLKVPAVVRFLSCEPLLEKVDISCYLHLPPCPQHPGEIAAGWGKLPCDCRPFIDEHVKNGRMGRIDWAIVGGESGAKARECNLDWLEGIADQCVAAGVPVFMKQLGARPFVIEGDVYSWWKISDRKGAKLEDWPKQFRQFRQFPEVA